MSVRTTPTIVRGLIDTDPAVTIDPFITSASALVDWLASVDEDGLLNGNLLTEIEGYLAAHFYEANKDRKLQSRSTGAASGSLQGATAMILMSSDPGQTACLLDVTNRLAQRSKEAEMGTKNKAQVIWMGTPCDD